MAPKKQEAEETPAEPAEPEEPGEPEILKKCFRIGGQVYYGDCKSDKDAPGGWVRHGYGRQVNSAETVTGEKFTVSTYEGYWVDDVMSGHGTFQWPDGSSYEGSFLDNEMNGFGRYVWPEGSSYSGMWVHSQMSGQGRFDSGFDGDFLQGDFHRNCFRQHDGQWLDVHREHRKAERLRIAEGEARNIQVRRCASREDFARALQETLDENLVPLIVADDSFQADPLGWLGEDRSEPSTVHLERAALAKRRQHDYRRLFYDAVQTSLLEYKWLTIVFDTAVEENPQTGTEDRASGLRLPEEWRLAHFFDPQSLPLEVFNLKIFNGRQMGKFFLPESDQKAAPPETFDEEEGGDDGDDQAMTRKMELLKQNAAVPQVANHLRAAVVTLGRIRSEISDSEVRAGVLARYSDHIPLHCTSVILLSAGAYLDDVGLNATRMPDQYSPSPPMSGYGDM